MKTAAAAKPDPGEETGAAFDKLSRRHRSQVTNGQRLFQASVDGRSGPARRYRDILRQLEADVGALNEAKRQLCRRAATLAWLAELMETDAVEGKIFDHDTYGGLCDRLGRCLSRLGLAPSLIEKAENKAGTVNVFRIIGGLPSPPPAAPKPVEEPIGKGPPSHKPEPPPLAAQLASSPSPMGRADK